MIRRKDGAKFNALSHRFLVAMCVTDFRYYLWFGAYYHARKHYRGRLFYRMATFLQENEKKMRFLIVGREHRKSQMLMAYKTWRLTGDTNRRCLIRAFQKEPNAKDICRGMLEIMESPRHRALFPWVKEGLKPGTRAKAAWSPSGIILDRSDTGIRVNSVAVHGFESDPTGGHFTDQFYDDFAVEESEKDVTRPALYSKFFNDDNLMMAGARRELAGTIWQYRGFMDSARLRKGKFEDLDYDVFYAPAEVQVMPQPIAGDSIAMADDRMTFKLMGLADELPHEGAGVRYCQAKLTFHNEDMTDTDVIVREVVWNNAREFRVNRPIETIYGNNLKGWTIGNYRPAAPQLFTMDVCDLLAPVELRDTQCDRGSLPAKRKAQGSRVYAAQMLLDPRSSDDCLFDSGRYKYISRQDFDDMVKHVKGTWYRKADLSSAKETGSFTAMVTGFVCDRGVFIRQMFWGLPKTHQIIHELFKGQIWLKSHYQAYLRHTQFETAHIENTVRENLEAAMRNPYQYFTLYPDMRAWADQNLSDGVAMFIPIHETSRGVSGKMDRINHHMTPILEAERLYIVEDIAHTDRLIEETDSATLETENGVDLLETVSDLCAEVKLPETERAEDRKRHPDEVNYENIQRWALRRNLFNAYASGRGKY